MSSGFVSGGTIENPAERDDEWRVAQAEIEERHRRKLEEGQQAEGKSLYEVLQANKAAKQEAFEEATRLKNQYRALDEDEAEFLDSVLEASRKKDEAIRKETIEQLDLFRKHQEEAERQALLEQNAGTPVDKEDTQWALGGRKRKKGHERGLLKGVKLRKESSADEDKESFTRMPAESEGKSKEQGASSPGTGNTQQLENEARVTNSLVEETTGSTKTTLAMSPPKDPAKPLALNLGYGSSDEDD